MEGWVLTEEERVFRKGPLGLVAGLKGRGGLKGIRCSETSNWVVEKVGEVVAAAGSEGVVAVMSESRVGTGAEEESRSRASRESGWAGWTRTGQSAGDETVVILLIVGRVTRARAMRCMVLIDAVGERSSVLVLMA